MNVIDFRFRPNTPEVINGIANSAMFKDLCEAIDFHKQKPEPFEDIIKGLDENNVVKAVITGRDCETTYASMANGNGALLDFCKNALKNSSATGALTRTKAWTLSVISRRW